jgi:hypothetical protein
MHILSSFRRVIHIYYPQIETKLTVPGADMDDIARKLAPMEEEVD